MALRGVVTKTSTGLVGIPVDPDGRKNMIAIYEKVLEAVKVSDTFAA
jgi:hypothetical protein